MLETVSFATIPAQISLSKARQTLSPSAEMKKLPLHISDDTDY